MPVFNSLSFFGVVQTERSVNTPNDVQLNAFPGVNGLQSLNMGSRGGRTAVRGTLFGANAAELETLQQTFRNLLAARTVAAYVNDAGTNLGPSYLEMFQPLDEEIAWYPGWGWGLEYVAVFVHLI